MAEFKLPQLIKVSDTKKKPKILLLSDDLRLFSGIASMSREFVIGTVSNFDWVQLGAALEHPDHGKIIDISKAVADETKVLDASVKIYAHTGYGNPAVLRELLALEKPDVILHFTDPRFWGWLYAMEYELRVKRKIPIAYYNIWDCPPAPLWNEPFYRSCDLIMNISKQTHQLVKLVLGYDSYLDVDTGIGAGNIKISHVSHGINPNKFYPITKDSPDYDNFIKFSEQFKKDNNCDFVIFWNNRNIRRKQPGDLILAYKNFCDRLSKQHSSKCVLFMHTHVQDENGTDLFAVREVCCPDYKIIFSEARIDDKTLNFFYNLASVTVNIASNEGFGLSGAESLMSGTPIINNVTGGLQDQCGFYMDTRNGDVPMEFNNEFTSNHTGQYRKHGKWAFPVFPSNRSLQGSLATPYIFDDRCKFEDVADALMEAWQLRDVLKTRGLEGREFALSNKSNMSSQAMCSGIVDNITNLMKTFSPPKRIRLIDTNKIKKYNGIIWK